MKQIVFNDKVADFFNSENKKILDNVAVTIIHKDTLEQKEKEIERLNNIINELEDSIVGKINVLYQVRGQSNAIQELDILLRQLRELKGDSSNE